MGGLVTGADLPDPIRLREVRRAFVEHNAGTIDQTAEDHHRAGQPAHIADPEQPVVLPDIHAQADIEGRLEREAAVGVHRALGLAGGAGGVDDHQR
ncbi:hypothetical protein D3C85_1010490 [compost metagenome]